MGRSGVRFPQFGQQFDAFEPLPGLHIKGQQTLGEITQLWSDPANWQRGYLYHCHADPRVRAALPTYKETYDDLVDRSHVSTTITMRRSSKRSTKRR